MLNLTMGLHRSCDRVTRRELLRVGSLAALGISLPGFLERRALAGSRGGKECFVHFDLAARWDQPHRQL